MAENEEVEETGSRRNEWEVVSLTASAYAASANPEIAGLKCDDRGSTYNVDDKEISRALFMSSHFVFPPSQHENLPLEPETIEVMEDDRGKGDGRKIVPEESVTTGKYEIDGSFGAPPNVYSKSHLLDDDDCGSVHAKDLSKSHLLDDDDCGSVHAKDFEEGMNPEEETHACSASCVDSLLSEAGVDGANLGLTADLSKLCWQRKGDDYDSDLPSGAWWKKTAASWYKHAKEANMFWSVFVTAAVMGIVIFGQTWQQERWKVLQHKWQMTVSNEKMGRILAPIYQLKDAVVSSHRLGSLIKARSSREN